MADDPTIITAPQPQLPSWLEQAGSAGARHALTMIGGFLLAQHWATQGQVDGIVANGVPFLLIVIGIVWSLLEKKFARTQFVQALLTPPPQMVSLLKTLAPLAQLYAAGGAAAVVAAAPAPQPPAPTEGQ